MLSMKVMLNGLVLAESDHTILLGTERYFPAEGVRHECLVKNGRTRFCHWKGYGELYDIVLKNETVQDGAWCFPHPFWEAADIKGMFAFDDAQVVISCPLPHPSPLTV